MKHLRSLNDLTANDVSEILALSTDLKSKLKQGKRPSLFENHVLGLLFEKPSLRTRSSFETAASQLGGSCIFYSCDDAGLNGRESTEDIARVFGSYVDVVAMRTFSQTLIDDFARYTNCPVINALSDDRHPCQALTDVLTIQEEIGELNGRQLVFVGDGNNVAASLVMAGALTGLSVTIASPEGYSLPEEFMAEVTKEHPSAKVQTVHDPKAAVEGADVVYTDVWASMGQEAEAKQRTAAFRGFQVNESLMKAAGPQAKFMHDLPAKRGLEVTDGVMDGEQSIVFKQAENRMHLAKGLLAWLVDERTA